VVTPYRVERSVVYFRSSKIPDERERRKWQNPRSTLLDAGLRPSITLVDIGCGDGFFALPAARIVGETGKVYAFDEDRDAIDRLKRKATIEGIKNLEAKIGKAEDTVLCEECADIVFFGIVLHGFKDPAKVLEKSKIMLKPNGRLVDVDWKKISMEVGPPLQTRFSEEEAARLIESVGFKIQTIRESAPYHYMIIATKH
jgi:ubiquinone/menaquinone biosynthesis C-methylase UbiE